MIILLGRIIKKRKKNKKKDNKKKPLSKRKYYYIMMPTLWAYTLLWIFSIYFIWIFTEIRFVYKGILSFVFGLVVPELDMLVQSYDSYKKNLQVHDRVE